MIVSFKDLFGQKEKEEPKKESKSNPTMDMIKKKILDQITKIEPKDIKPGLHNMMFSQEFPGIEYSDDHHEKLQKFLHKPSMTELKDLKQNGEWKHLNKIFAEPYEQE